MDIRTIGAWPLRRADLGQGPRGGSVAPQATGTREQRVFPPPTPVTQQMLPSHKAARSAEAGARQAYQSARDMMRDD